MDILSLLLLGDRCFLGCEPIIGAMIDVFTPGFGGKPEILCQQIRKVRRGFSRKHTLYEVLMIGISLWLSQKDPATWLGAENIPALVFDENIRGIFVRSAAAQRQLAQIAKGWHGAAMHS